MTDDIWSRQEIASPCTKVCMIHPAAGICVGCFRTGTEIAHWSAMTDAERATIMAELPAREPRLTQRRGGRSGRSETP